MNRTLIGALAALLLTAAGLFWWQGRAISSMGEKPPQVIDNPSGDSLPGETGEGMQGAAPPEVNEATKEQRRFDHLDKNRDGKITRTEMLMPRVNAFRKLDTDGNNLLSFEEWSVRTTNKFKKADANGDGILDRAEFLTTKAKKKAKPGCKCGGEKPARKARGAAPAQDNDSGDDGDPAG